MFASILVAAPSSAMAKQITATTIPPLTPEEQQQQDRLQNTIAATTRNLAQGQKEVDGVVYTPRWSSPVWVEPNNSLSILFVYCLPGEFADAGQEILGGSELEVLESYSLAVTNDLMVWLMVVENENQTNRVPAAVGVICASDLNDAETRVLSPQEETEINNIFQQFITIRTTQITNITQVINIINNVTTNGTGGVVTPPTNGTGVNDTGGPTIPPPPTNGTGGGNDTGGVTPEPLTVAANWDTLDGTTAPATYRLEGDALGGTAPYTFHWDFGDGQQATGQNVRHTYENPGSYTATLTVADATGQTASDTTPSIHVDPAPTTAGEPPTTDETGGGVAEPTTNETGGQQP